MNGKKRVLFVCIGNMCRSPMAEALARKYGSDVIEASSAGLYPATGSHPLTRAVLAEKNVELGEHVPRRFHDLSAKDYDLIINLSGEPLGEVTAPVIEWEVEDPVCGGDAEFRQAREEIEMRVMQLILRIRAGKFDSIVPVRDNKTTR